MARRDTTGRDGLVPGVLGASLPALPDWARAEVERRTLERAERRDRRLALRPYRRARRSVQSWLAGAAVTPLAAAVDVVGDDSSGNLLGWLAVGLGCLLGAGMAHREASRAAVTPPGLPLATAPAPKPAALWRSAAAAPLRRGESALNAFAAMMRSLGPGPTTETLRSAMVAAAEVVDGLRVYASRVVAFEAAARAMSDRARRREVDNRAEVLLARMTAAAEGLDELLDAASEMVAAASGDPWATGNLAGGGSRRLDDEIARLRGFTAGLRETIG